ncbi:MAG: DUF3570 domain-containing protein, partial [Gammaproteobacteria bacterium]
MSQKPGNTSKKALDATLQALTSAALVLPGLLGSAAEASDENSVEFQYSHYQEGSRELFNVPNTMNPIEVDSVHAHSGFSLTDRIRFAFQYTQDTWSGATPVASAPLAANSNRPTLANLAGGVVTTGASPILNSSVQLNRDMTPVRRDPFTGRVLGIEARTVHILASASPETRKQGDFKLSYEWDEATLDVGGGVSVENDYESRFGNIGGSFDFNQKSTTLKWSASYTDSDTSAILDHDAAPYITKTAFADQIEVREGSEILHGNKQDWAAQLGLTQILSKTALFDFGAGYTYSSGYLENPYKVTTVIFVDPAALASEANRTVSGDVRALLEQRPDGRSQWAFNSRYVQYIEPLDAALHLRYQFSHDNWGINAHVFEADWVQPFGAGWTVTPRVRYYSQSAADFYTPYLTSLQPFNKRALDAQGREIWVDASDPVNGTEYVRDENFNLVDAGGNIVDESLVNVRPKTQAFDPGRLPNNFSSDHRLSGFGALSGGISVAKAFAKGVSIEAGIEYYTHAGSLKLGGGGEGAYADFDYFAANAALKVDLSALSSHAGETTHTDHVHGTEHGLHGHFLPAGIMAGHFMKHAGDLMVGYRFMYGRKAGDTLHGTTPAGDLQIVQNGCSDTIQCRFTPPYMNMSMHMLNIMYAPTEWLNLMLMPKFADMEMNLRELEGRPPPDPNIHEHTGLAGHATGLVGDTALTALMPLFDEEGHRVHVGLGISAPTGDPGLEFRRTFQQDGGLVHFGMQLGSGTWDFLPSVTYSGDLDDWFWGAQVNGILR